VHKQIKRLAWTSLTALLVVSGFEVADATAAVHAVSDVRNPTKLQVDGVSYSLDVEIAAGAAGDDSLARGVYVFRLKCSADISCSLERVSLNECTTTDASGPGFSPRVDSWSTWSGQLAVRQIGSHEIEATLYQALGKKLPASVTFTFASGHPHPFKAIAEFKTSGFIDPRHWPDAKKGIEYVAIQKDRMKMLDCPIALHGLQR
jgi:hypothetical protein